jgi:hypothetical protein
MAARLPFEQWLGRAVIKSVQHWIFYPNKE